MTCYNNTLTSPADAMQTSAEPDYTWTVLATERNQSNYLSDDCGWGESATNRNDCH